jgi:hypothetical protein
MRMSCGDCALRNLACGECVVGSLLGPSTGAADFGEGELAAIEVLAAAGLVPRLRWSPSASGVTVTKVTHTSRNHFRARAKAGAIAR